MDCRKSLVMALSLVTTSLGCVGPFNWLKAKDDAPKPETSVKVDSPAKVQPPPKVESLPEGTTVTPATDLPRRTPKASTCVAYGNFRAKEANKPALGPVEQQLYRDQARKAFLQAIRIDRKCLPAYTGLASLYCACGDQDKALETYQKALKIYPKEASLWMEMGMCHSRQKQWDKAIEELRKAVQLAPENRLYGSTLGFALARAGRFSDSIEVFTALVGKAEAHYQVARMAHHMRQDEQSKEFLRLALSDKPDHGGAQHLLAQLEGRAPANPVVQAGYEGREGATPSPGAGQ
jgi:hypothetical protein